MILQRLLPFGLLTILISNSAMVINAQDIYYSKDSLTSRQRFISEVEFSIGASVIYGSANEFGRNNRVPNIGFYTALGVTKTLNSWASFNLKVAYEQKGVKFVAHIENMPGVTPPVPVKLVDAITLNYVTTTFMPRFFLKRNLPLYVGGGPYAGYLLSSKIIGEVYINGMLDTRYILRSSPNDQFEKFDFGLSFMLGYKFDIIKKIETSLQFMYSHGLTDVVHLQYSGDLNNNTFSLAAAFRLTAD